MPAPENGQGQADHYESYEDFIHSIYAEEVKDVSTELESDFLVKWGPNQILYLTFLSSIKI